MGDYAELFLALPMARLPEIGRQLGESVPPDMAANIAANIEVFGPSRTAYAAIEKLMQAVSRRITPTITSVPSPFEHVTDDSMTFCAVYNDQGDPRLNEIFVGIQLHSTYHGKGIPEAQAAAIGDGYAITPELLAATDGLRQALAGLAPASAEASLVVYITHW